MRFDLTVFRGLNNSTSMSSESVGANSFAHLAEFVTFECENGVDNSWKSTGI